MEDTENLVSVGADSRAAYQATEQTFASSDVSHYDKDTMGKELHAAIEERGRQPVRARSFRTETNLTALDFREPTVSRPAPESSAG